jgi:hypothetical protein
MGIEMFIIGFLIFIVYVYFLIWNIFYSTKKQIEENRYSNQPDVLDSDGMGDFSRFPSDKN